MKAIWKSCVLAAFVAGGCVDSELDGDELDDLESVSQEVGAPQVIYHAQVFGGSIFSESHDYVTPGTCPANYIRANTPTVQWTSQSGGFCAFNGWNNPADVHDCRAKIHAVTGGGWFGGTCHVWVTAIELGKLNYSATNTNSAQQNTVNQNISLNAGQMIVLGTCGTPDSTFSGDTFLRLINPSGAQVAFNDDAGGTCGVGSKLTHTASTSGTYQLRAGCFSGSSCSGTVTWNAQ